MIYLISTETGVVEAPSIGSFGHSCLGVMLLQKFVHSLDCVEVLNFPVSISVDFVPAASSCLESTSLN